LGRIISELRRGLGGLEAVVETAGDDGDVQVAFGG